MVLSFALILAQGVTSDCSSSETFISISSCHSGLLSGVLHNDIVHYSNQEQSAASKREHQRCAAFAQFVLLVVSNVLLQELGLVKWLTPADFRCAARPV